LGEEDGVEFQRKRNAAASTSGGILGVTLKYAPL
jgi:hypothetical protein